MKIDIKAGGQKYSVDFKIMPGSRDTHLSAIPKSSKDLDELQTAISNRGAGDDMIGVIVGKAPLFTEYSTLPPHPNNRPEYIDPNSELSKERSVGLINKFSSAARGVALSNGTANCPVEVM